MTVLHPNTYSSIRGEVHKATCLPPISMIPRNTYPIVPGLPGKPRGPLKLLSPVWPACPFRPGSPFCPGGPANPKGRKVLQ